MCLPRIIRLIVKSAIAITIITQEAIFLTFCLNFDDSKLKQLFH